MLPEAWQEATFREDDFTGTVSGRYVSNGTKLGELVAYSSQLEDKHKYRWLAAIVAVGSGRSVFVAQWFGSQRRRTKDPA
jgi:hypothetical protein